MKCVDIARAQIPMNMISMSIITREEYRVYNRVKAKLLYKDVATQTCDDFELEPASKEEQLTEIESKTTTSVESQAYTEEDETKSKSLPPNKFRRGWQKNAVMQQQMQSPFIMFTMFPNQKRKASSSESEEEYAEDTSNDSDMDEESYTYHEMMYLKSLDKNARKKMREDEKQIQMTNNPSLVPLRFRILNSSMPVEIKSLLLKKLYSIIGNRRGFGDSTKELGYIEGACALPLGVYKSIDTAPFDNNAGKFFSHIQSTLDKAVYGHENAKMTIIKLFAQWMKNPNSRGMVIGIVGDMGVGKTQLVKEGICKSLGLPFGFIPLGGASDSSFLLGHSFTYEGSKWGRIAEVLMDSKCMNPILYFDELDKVSNSHHGEEIINVLIHLTDPVQNESFADKYFTEIPIDLSKCLIIFSFNSIENINPILMDRIALIHTSSYSAADKLKIFKEHLLPRTMLDFGFVPGDVCFTDDLIKTMIAHHVHEEKGVRNLQRALRDIISHLNYMRMLDPNKTAMPFMVNEAVISKALESSTSKGTNNVWKTMYM